MDDAECLLGIVHLPLNVRSDLRVTTGDLLPRPQVVTRRCGSSSGTSSYQPGHRALLTPPDPVPATDGGAAQRALRIWNFRRLGRWLRIIRGG